MVSLGGAACHSHESVLACQGKLTLHLVLDALYLDLTLSPAPGRHRRRVLLHRPRELIGGSGLGRYAVLGAEGGFQGALDTLRLEGRGIAVALNDAQVRRGGRGRWGVRHSALRMQ